MAGMAEKVQTKREMTAREWLLVIAAGLVVAVIAAPLMGAAAIGLGVAIVLVGALGLAWRLLKDR